MPNLLRLVRELLYTVQGNGKENGYTSEPIPKTPSNYGGKQPAIVPSPIAYSDGQSPASLLEDGALRLVYDELADRGFAGRLYNFPTIKLSGADGRVLGERLAYILEPLGATLQIKSRGAQVRVPTYAHQRYRDFVDSLNGNRRDVTDRHLVA